MLNQQRLPYVKNHPRYEYIVDNRVSAIQVQPLAFVFTSTNIKIMIHISYVKPTKISLPAMLSWCNISRPETALNGCAIIICGDCACTIILLVLIRHNLCLM